ncbi:hypothetical protein J2Z24_000300 [Clostridium tetanomorphum]|nr:hypothetical protein [Clostridium tetanomorphum]
MVSEKNTLDDIYQSFMVDVYRAISYLYAIMNILQKI